MLVLPKLRPSAAFGSAELHPDVLKHLAVGEVLREPLYHHRDLGRQSTGVLVDRGGEHIPRKVGPHIGVVAVSEHFGYVVVVRNPRRATGVRTRDHPRADAILLTVL